MQGISESPPPPKMGKVGADSPGALGAQPSGEEIDRALKALEKKRQKDKKRLQKEAGEAEQLKNSRRQKTQKAQAKAEQAPQEGDMAAASEAAKQYLLAWKHRKGLWRFQKVRQVWLLKNIYNSELVTDETFDIFINYIAPLKGAARELTLKQAEDVLTKVGGEEVGEDEDEQDTETVKGGESEATIQQR